MATYQPSGKVGVGGVLVLFGMGLFVGGWLGALVHFVGRAFYLIFVFPFVWGLVLGGSLSGGVRMGRCRNVSLALLAGLISAVSSYALYHALDNWKVRTDAKENLKKAGIPADMVDALYDEHLKKEYGGTGFWGEVKMRSTFGMSIGRPGRSGDSKPLITGIGMYIYWILELGVVAGCAILLPRTAARASFCEPCLAWYAKKDAAVVTAGMEAEVQRALSGRDPGALGPCFGGAGTAVLALEKCPKCSTGSIRFLLEQVTKDPKGNEKRETLFDEMVSHEEANALLAGVLAPKPPPAPPPA